MMKISILQVAKDIITINFEKEYKRGLTPSFFMELIYNAFDVTSQYVMVDSK